MTWDYEYDVVVVGSGAALVADNIKEIYLKKGIQMLDYMHNLGPHMRFSYAKNYSDYYPTHPGGKGKGRSIEPEVIDLNKLQDWKSMLLPPSMDTKGFGQDKISLK